MQGIAAERVLVRHRQDAAPQQEQFSLREVHPGLACHSPTVVVDACALPVAGFFGGHLVAQARGRQRGAFMVELDVSTGFDPVDVWL